MSRRVGLVLVTVLLPTHVRAQAREIRRYDVSDPEGRLMAYYSATLAFSPVGVLTASAAGQIVRAEIGLTINRAGRATAQSQTCAA